MTVTKKYCDSCGQEVRWLYTMPRIEIAGLRVQIENERGRELCEKCARDLIELYDAVKFKHLGGGQKEGGD